MTSVSSEAAVDDPVFITRLFSLKRYYCHFTVGNKDLVEPETIGVVAEMLIVHSEVLQSEMFYREIEDKKCVTVNDMYPDTFRNLLRYVYGHDITPSLKFEEADNLLYAAEKYMIITLKNRLADRLIKLLNPDNVCCLLNNPVCYTQLELNSALTQILQYETDKVLASTHFLELSLDALLKVVEQQSMNVTEIEVWRASIKWAKHRTNSDNGQDLRKTLESPLKHIRVCTIPDVEFVEEVCPASILTAEEINMVFFSKVSKEIQDDLTNLSNNINSRTKHVLPCELCFNKHTGRVSEKSTELYIIPKEYAIELSPLKLNSNQWRHDSFVPSGLTYQSKCTITITRITDYITNTSSEPPEVVEVCQQVEYNTEFYVPVEKDGKIIMLLPNNKYRVSVDSAESIVMCTYTIIGIHGSDRFEDEHLSLLIPSKYDRSYNQSVSKVPFKTLFYRPIGPNSQSTPIIDQLIK